MGIVGWFLMKGVFFMLKVDLEYLDVTLVEFGWGWDV